MVGYRKCWEFLYSFSIDLLYLSDGLMGVRSEVYFKLRTCVPVGLTGAWLGILSVASLCVPDSPLAGCILG